jgi:predicted ThiF/HesA family dinucleotide-utilizing enzyme
MAVVRLNKTTYANIDTFDIGEYPNIGYGSIDDVRCHCIVGGATTRATADITAVATSITVEDISRFPATPFVIQVEEERMNVTNVASSTMTVTRGYDNTTAIAHKKRETIFEALTEYVYLVANHAVKAINSVSIDDLKQNTGDSRITFYTGQAGDAHTDWPGVAVIAFTSDAYIAPQFNADNANLQESGEAVAGIVNIATDKRMYDGTSDYYQAPIGTTPFVQFTADSGTILYQDYSVAVSNNSSTDEVVGLLSVVKEGTAAAIKAFTIDTSTSETLTISSTGGSFDDEIRIAISSGEHAEGLRIRSVSKTTTRKREKYKTDNTNNATATPAKEIEILKSDGTPSITTYDTTALGTTIVSETHRATIEVTTAGRFRLVSYDESTDDAFGFKDFELRAGTHTISHEVSTGDWDSATKLIVEYGACVVTSLDKTIEYQSEITESQDTFFATASARVVVGENITVNADWAVDTIGDYGGASTLIERPDWVIKHFLIVHLGFASGEIASTSFTAAGTSYGTDSYAFGLIWNGELVERMAFEARSTINYSAGKWYLNRLPDTAPAATKTITKTELAGEKALFVFDKMPTYNIQNELTARYLYNYKDNSFDGVVTDNDSTSKTKYGTYYGEYDFRFIRDATMAAHVLAHILLQKKDTLKDIYFDLFWEHFDLSVGDTIDITNDIYNAEKFYIEGITRNNTIAQITGKEWW